jgi:hypothetical protein
VAVIGAGSNLGKAALVPDGSGGFATVPLREATRIFPLCRTGNFDFKSS